MTGITFGTKHSYNDFHLILASKEIGAPTVKTSQIDIPGADGVLDMTDFFGEPKYENVQHKFEFSTIIDQRDFIDLYSTIKNAIHGIKMRIILDDDPAHYYLGRCFVSSFLHSRNIGLISVECDCEPYKYRASKTVVTSAVEGTKAITLTNSRKRAVPEITTTAAMTIAYGDGIWTTSAGTYTIPELELVEGDNTVEVTGTGSITFRWQEGDL